MASLVDCLIKKHLHHALNTTDSSPSTKNSVIFFIFLFLRAGGVVGSDGPESAVQNIIPETLYRIAIAKRRRTFKERAFFEDVIF